MPRDVRLILRDAGIEQIRATKALQPGRDVLVVPPGIVTAGTADDLNGVGVPAVQIATHGVGNWVFNLRVAGEGILSLGWSRQAFTAVELTPEAAGSVIQEVFGPLLASGGLRGAALRQNLGVTADASLHDYINAARSHPVFALGSPDKPSFNS